MQASLGRRNLHRPKQQRGARSSGSHHGSDLPCSHHGIGLAWPTADVGGHARLPCQVSGTDQDIRFRKLRLVRWHEKLVQSSVLEAHLGHTGVFTCANTSMDWLPFRDLLAMASGVHDTLSEDVDYMRSTSNHWAAWPLVAGRHPGKHPELQQSLYQLLITHAGSKCKDPRDRVFALLGLVTPNERVLLERFLPDYAMSEDNVVLIALCHVQLDVCGMDRGELDLKRLLWALGVDSRRRRQRLIRRSDKYDYLGDEPPNMHWGWFDDDEENDFDATTWRNIADSVYDESHFRHWDAEPDARSAGHRSCCSKRTMYALGMIALLVVYLKVYKPHVWKTSVSLILRTVAKLRRLADSFRGQSSNRS